MKNFRFFAAIAAFAMITLSSNIYAQGPRQGNGQDRVMSEKIAFITAVLELTPEEAQVFWPVYNQINAQKKEAQKAVKEARKALSAALEDGTATDKEIDRLLDCYIAAKLDHNKVGKENTAKLRNVLSSKKTARLFLAEEDFKRHQIRNIKSPHGPKGYNGRPEHRK